ncbi:MAG TPA: hypothetical protein VKS98_08880, partial [Chthoniobacterales bacterium]|nr:hypothetical protein [Chthoniobacterales bacterium]
MPESDSERLKLTPEQRRFLGGARSANPPAAPEQKPAVPEPAAKVKGPAPVPSPPSETPSQPEQHHAPRRTRGTGTSKKLEMQKLAVVAGALILLVATFYVGKKFEYWRYLIATRNEAKIAAKATGDFAG